MLDKGWEDTNDCSRVMINMVGREIVKHHVHTLEILLFLKNVHGRLSIKVNQEWNFVLDLRSVLRIRMADIEYFLKYIRFVSQDVQECLTAWKNVVDQSFNLLRINLRSIDLTRF
jgi:hypothetical protein